MLAHPQNTQGSQLLQAAPMDCRLPQGLVPHSVFDWTAPWPTSKPHSMTNISPRSVFRGTDPKGACVKSLTTQQDTCKPVLHKLSVRGESKQRQVASVLLNTPMGRSDASRHSSADTAPLAILQQEAKRKAVTWSTFMMPYSKVNPGCLQVQRLLLRYA